VVGESLEGEQAVPAFDGMVGTSYQLVMQITGDTCVPHTLYFDEVSGYVPCALMQVVPAQAPDVCDCPGLGQPAPGEGSVDALKQELRNRGECDAGEGSPACDDLCFCELVQASGAALQACQNDVEFDGSEAFCVVDPAQGYGNGDLVADCPETRQTLVRLSSEVEALEGAAYLTCLSGYGSRPVQRLGLGETCTPSIETSSGFAGFTTAEVSLETGAAGCESNVCLVHHFQGRTNCPYGQTTEQASSKPACFVPGSSILPIDTAVEPQLVSRPPELAAICSCRCDGPDDAIDYCDCPDSMQCVPMVNSFQLGAGVSRRGHTASPKRHSPPKRVSMDQPVTLHWRTVVPSNRKRYVAPNVVAAIVGLLLSLPLLADAEQKTALLVHRPEGAEGCPDAEQLAGQVHAIVGREVIGSGPGHDAAWIEVTMTRLKHEYFATVHTFGSSVGRREISDAGPDCSGLAEAVAVSLALMWSSDETRTLVSPEPEQTEPNVVGAQPVESRQSHNEPTVPVARQRPRKKSPPKTPAREEGPKNGEATAMVSKRCWGQCSAFSNTRFPAESLRDASALVRWRLALESAQPASIAWSRVKAAWNWPWATRSLGCV
jgi:hypothetical protein